MHPNLTNEPDRANEFIESAIEKGFSEICFTDHMPLSIDNAGDRIKKGNINQYCEAIQEKAKEYEGVIKIKTGIEIDYHPDFINEIETVLEQGTFDYIIGASHLHIPGFDIKMATMTPDEFAKMSFENSLLAIKSGYFDTIAHLDLQRWVYTLPKRFKMLKGEYDIKNHISIIKEIMKELEKNKVKLEINTIAILHKVSDEGAYPCHEIMNISYDYNIDYVFGSDAHSYDRVGEGYDKLKESKEYGRALK